MFWIYFVSGLMACLAVLLAVLQYGHELIKKKEETAQAKELAAAYKKISGNYEEIIKEQKFSQQIQERNRKETKEKTDAIMALQAQLNEKQTELNQKNELLLVEQKEGLNYFTGGDEMVAIMPSAMAGINNEIVISLYNTTKYPQHSVYVTIHNHLMLQILDHLNNPAFKAIPNIDMYENTLFTQNYEQIAPNQKIDVFKINIPEPLDSTHFDVVIRSTNGQYTKRIVYKKINPHLWALQDINSYLLFQ